MSVHGWYIHTYVSTADSHGNGIGSRDCSGKLHDMIFMPLPSNTAMRVGSPPSRNAQFDALRCSAPLCPASP